MKRAVWYAIALSIAALSIYVAYLSVRIARQSTRDEAQPADVILVLGAAEYRGLHSAIVVSDGYHIYRVKQMLRASGLVVYGSPRKERNPGLFRDWWNNVKQ